MGNFANLRLQKERKILVVIALTVFAMVCEIVLGHLTNSMGLIAQGYHMSVHVLTLALTYIAYVLARKYRGSERFENGTSKIGVLAGYTSALFLGLAGFHILHEAVHRFFHATEIHYTQAIYAAIFALIINYICISIMEGNFNLHQHKHKKKKDYNYKAAYYHILADVLVSLLTIIALVLGKYFNCIHLDALTGMFGAILILIWAGKLIKNTVKILVDMK